MAAEHLPWRVEAEYAFDRQSYSKLCAAYEQLVPHRQWQVGPLGHAAGSSLASGGSQHALSRSVCPRLVRTAEGRVGDRQSSDGTEAAGGQRQLSAS